MEKQESENHARRLHIANIFTCTHVTLQGRTSSADAAALYDFLTTMKQRRLEDVRRVKRHLDMLYSDIQEVCACAGARG